MHADEPYIRFNEIEFDIIAIIFAFGFQQMDINIKEMVPAPLITIATAIFDNFNNLFI